MRTHFDSDRDERSWRTVEPARIDPGNDVDQPDHQAFADNTGSLERDHGGKNAGEERVQCTARIGMVIGAAVAMGMRFRRVITRIHVMVMYVRKRSSRIFLGED